MLSIPELRIQIQFPTIKDNPFEILTEKPSINEKDPTIFFKERSTIITSLWQIKNQRNQEHNNTSHKAI